MLTDHFKYSRSILLSLLAGISAQAVASDSPIRDQVESFEVAGLTLNSSVEEFEAVTKDGYSCRVDEGGEVAYWTCRSKGGEHGNSTLKVSIESNEIVSIHLKSQSSGNAFKSIRNAFGAVNQRLLDEGQKATRRNYSGDYIFYFMNDDSPAMPKTELAVKTTFECSTVEPSIFGLTGMIMTLGGASGIDDMTIHVYKMTNKQC